MKVDAIFSPCWLGIVCLDAVERGEGQEGGRSHGGPAGEEERGHAEARHLSGEEGKGKGGAMGQVVVQKVKGMSM